MPLKLLIWTRDDGTAYLSYNTSESLAARHTLSPAETEVLNIVADIAGAVRLLMSGEDEISTYKEGAEQHPVTMRLLPAQRDNPALLTRLLVPSSRLGLIRLDSVARLERDHVSLLAALCDLEQERTAALLYRMVQAPQTPCSHPRCVPVRLSSSRRKSARVMRTATVRS